MALELVPVVVKKEIQRGDDLAKLFLSGFKGLQDGDVVVVSQKAVSKQEGRLVDLTQVIPSLLAVGIAAEYQKDPKLVEVILSEAHRIIRMDGGILITETRHGFVCANSGVDESNIPEGFASMLPADPDVSARDLRDKLHAASGKKIAVIISDTFGRPFREGQTNHAIGVAGMHTIEDYAGKKDVFDKTLRVTAIAHVDELAGAAELVMKKTKNCPFAVVRNYEFEFADAKIESLLRKKETDLFR
jgi:coenzyme F420-0:L-glutamate ligase/coenzyme F420-1:gamma-L-glutamate ligase